MFIEDERKSIKNDLDRILEAAFSNFRDEKTSTGEQLNWGRLIVRILGEKADMAKDEMLERNREDLENVKAILRLRGEEI